MKDRLNIAIIGYGKMGKMIEQAAISKGHAIACVIEQDSSEEDWSKIKKADVAIEFTQPHSAVSNIYKCFENNIPVVVGTTGWYDKYDEVSKKCEEMNGSLFTATNFSIGVNLFFHINKLLAKSMNQLPEYSVEIEEIHHTQKKDAPSGTAISIAQGIIENIGRLNQWELSNENLKEGIIPITAIRQDDVPGTHFVKYCSEIDCIEIKHKAHNRTGFAIGAIIASEWSFNKTGCFKMDDLIGF